MAFLSALPLFVRFPPLVAGISDGTNLNFPGDAVYADIIIAVEVGIIKDSACRETAEQVNRHSPQDQDREPEPVGFKPEERSQRVVFPTGDDILLA